jgi:branched-chain amino acid transport system permease protein
MHEFMQQLVNGVARGSEYALWTVGYGLVYQVLGLMHFAHGDTLLVCLYIAFTFVVTLAAPLYIALPAVIVIGAIIAMTIERAVYRPLVVRGDTISAFIAALGAAYIIRNFVTLEWGRDVHVLPDLLPSRFITVQGIVIDTTPMLVLATAVLVVGIFGVFLRRTRSGQAILLIAQDRSTAALMGIPVARMVTLVYALSGAIGVIGALLFFATNRTLDPTLGLFITLKAFVAAIIGGIGRIEGAILGGLLLGILEVLVIGYVSDTFSDAIVFGILAFVLIVRPNGLLGRRELVKL